MKRKKQVRLFRKRWRKARKHLKDFTTSKNQDSLHDFRVEIKKLDSLISLLGTSAHNRLRQAFKPVKKIYKRTGAIREAHVFLLLMTKFGITQPELEREQREVLIHSTERFCNKRKKNLKAFKGCWKAIKGQLRAVNNNTFLVNYASLLYSVALSLKRGQFNSELHDCRKDIKNLLYNQKTALAVSEDELRLDNDYLDNLQEAIGQWHDAVIIKALFLEKEPEPGIITFIDQEIEVRKGAIISLSDNFPRKAIPSDR